MKNNYTSIFLLAFFCQHVHNKQLPSVTFVVALNFYGVF